MVEIVLSVFNSTITPVKANAIDNPINEATVDIEVNIDDFRQAFQIQTSDDLLNVVTVGEGSAIDTDIHYYVDKSKLTSAYSFYSTTATKPFNPALGQVKLNASTVIDVSGDTLTAPQLGAVNDYMRDLSKQLFGYTRVVHTIEQMTQTLT
jgi:hypothetical protein